jgi:very-short-patch-repair endonuclease
VLRFSYQSHGPYHLARPRGRGGFRQRRARPAITPPRTRRTRTYRPDSALSPSELLARQRLRALRSTLSSQFERIALAHHLPPFHAEFKFCPTRRWRFDYAWPAQHVAVELEGAPGHGRHTSVKGFLADLAKYNAATANGWRILRFTGHDLKSPGAALDLIRATLGTAPA